MATPDTGNRSAGILLRVSCSACLSSRMGPVPLISSDGVVMGHSYFVCPVALIDNWQEIVEAECSVRSSIDKRSIRERLVDHPDLTFPSSVEMDAPGDGVLFRKDGDCVRVSCNLNTDLQVHTLNFSYDRTSGNVKLARSIWDALQNAGAFQHTG